MHGLRFPEGELTCGPALSPVRCSEVVFCAALGDDVLLGGAGLVFDHDAHTALSQLSGQPGSSRASHRRGCSDSSWSSGEVKEWDLASLPEAKFQEVSGVMCF